MDFWMQYSLMKPHIDSLWSSATNFNRKRNWPGSIDSPLLVDLGTVIKAPLDSKNYKVVQLPNGLKATLVSTCLHETRTYLTGGNKLSHSNTKSPSTLSGESSPFSLFQEDIDKFNKTYLGIQAYNQLDNSSSIHKKPSGFSSWGQISNVKQDSKVTDPQASTLPSKAPKLVKCCKGHAAICVSVGAGYFHDPRNTQGMAHFVEHLIFRGSKQHPEPNKLHTTVYENGGLVNATTSAEQTKFFFACDSSAFGKCVEILVDGLTNPLFREADLRREMEAVDSEYAIKQTHDFTRISDFIYSRARVGHPFRTFSWGNKASLNHPDIRLRVQDWKKRYYRANHMTVCIQAPMPMKKLEQFVLQHFSDIPSSSLETKSLSEELLTHHGPPYSAEDFQRMYFLVPVTHLNCVVISWALPADLWKNYETKPLEYVILLLQNTEKGGLGHYLRQNEWMTEWGNLQATCSHMEDRNVFTSMFSISVLLTDKGYKEKDEVIKVIFSYLKMLSRGGVKQRYFEEMNRTAATKFHFHNWNEILQSAMKIAVAMQHVPAPHILTSATLLTKWSPDEIKWCIDLLTPRTANFILVSRDNVRSCKETALPCGVRFTKQDIKEHYYQLLQDIIIYPGFEIPPDGTFLAREITLKSEVEGAKPLGTIVQTDKLVVHHENMKKSPCLAPIIPSVYLSVYLSSHLVSGHSSRIKEGVLYFWGRLLTDKIIHRVGHQFDNLFGYEIAVNDDGISVHLQGPRCYLVDLLTTVVRHVYECDPPSKDETDIRENLKIELIRQFTNETYDLDMLSRDMASYLLEANHASLFEIQNELKDISFDDGNFQRTVKKFRRRTLISVDLLGAVTKEDADRIVLLFTGGTEENIQYARPPILPQNTGRATTLPRGTSRLCIKAVHPSFVTTVVTNIYQVNLWDGNNALEFVLSLCSLLRRRIIDQLRTNEQLGYIVRLSPVLEAGSIAISTTVIAQPEKHAADYVDSRIDAFFRNFYSKSLTVKEVRRWIRDKFGFDEKTLREFERFYRDNLLKSGTNFRKLSIQLEGYEPTAKISAKKREKLNDNAEMEGLGEGGMEDVESMIQLEYMTVEDNKQKGRLKKEAVHIIQDVAQYKRKMSLLPIHN